MSEVTVVGGGIAGLTAAIVAAEAGAPVRLLEAHGQLGGRARTTGGPFVAGFGPRGIYADGSMWRWLAARDLLPAAATPRRSGIRFVHRGRLRAVPPRTLAPLRKVLGTDAPVDASFRDWVAARAGDESTEAICRAAGFFTYDHDPGRLSAAFVAEHMRRLWRLASPTRFPHGGFGALVAVLERRARDLGVAVETGHAVRELPAGPVVVAVELRDAARLLGDASLAAPGAHSVLIDLGLRSRRRWPFSALSLDDAAFAETVSQRDPSIAPPGHSLVQAQAGVRPGETVDAAAARLETLLDASLRGWRERVVWRRRMVSDERSGAVDLPGSTWRDRPAIDRGDGVWLAGDMVAAAGLLGEVACASGDEAGRAAAAQLFPARPSARRAAR
jgi:phytoene dehydrogenase-like protein